MRLIPIITRTLAERLPFTQVWLRIRPHPGANGRSAENQALRSLKTAFGGSIPVLGSNFRSGSTQVAIFVGDVVNRGSRRFEGANLESESELSTGVLRGK